MKCEVTFCSELADRRIIVRWYEYRDSKRVEIPDSHDVCKHHVKAYGVPSEIIELERT